MPRVNLGKSKYESLASLIYGGAKANKKTQAELAERLGVSARTISSRLAKPEEFTLKEIGIIGRYIGVDIEVLRAAAIKY